MLNVPWCSSASILIVNEAHQPLTDVALFHDSKMVWRGRLDEEDVEQVTVPTPREGGVEIRVTLGDGTKLKNPGPYVTSLNYGYDVFYVDETRIDYDPVTGSGYLGLGGDGGFATFLEFTDLGIRYITCPVRWVATSISF